MGHIKGNRDGRNGRNDTYRVGSRPAVPRIKVVEEVRAGIHPHVHVVKINGKEYVRDNPDSSVRDNVNR